MTKFAPESFTEEELMTNADVRKATGRYLLMKDGPEQQALGLKIVEAQERLNRATQYERSQHFEPLYRGGVEKLEGKFIDLPGMAYSPDPTEDIAAGVNQNYVAAECNLDPDQVGNLWQWYRGEFSREKFGFEVPSDTEFFRLNAKWESKQRVQREKLERELGGQVLVEAAKPSLLKEGTKSVFGGMSDGSLTAVQGMYRQGAAVLRMGSEVSWLDKGERGEWAELNARQARLERVQEINAEGGHGDEELDEELGEIRLKIGQLREIAQKRKDQGFREQVASAYEENAESIGRLKAFNAEFYKVSPEFQASFVGKVLYGAGQMVPQVLVAQLPGIGAAALQSQAFEYTYEDAKATAARKGQYFDEEKAFKYAFVVSLQNALLEKAGIDAAFGKWMKGGGKKTLQQFLKRVGSGATGEGITEVVQGGASDFVASKMDIEQRDVLDWNKRWEEFSLGVTLGGVGAATHAGVEMLPSDEITSGQERLTEKGSSEEPPKATGFGLFHTGVESTLPKDDPFRKSGQYETFGSARFDSEPSKGYGGASAAHEEKRLAQTAFETLGVRIIEVGGFRPAIDPQPNGEILLRYPSAFLSDIEEVGIGEGLNKGTTTRVILGEELIHAAHVLNLREKWRAEGSPGSFRNYLKRAHEELFADLKSAIEKSPVTQREVLLRIIRDSYDAYFSENGQERASRGNHNAILEELQDSPMLMNFIGEFIRQAAQLKRQGVLSEEVSAFLMNALKRLADWMREATNTLRKGLPRAYDGEFGQSIRKALEEIDARLDEIDGKPPMRPESDS